MIDETLRKTIMKFETQGYEVAIRYGDCIFIKEKKFTSPVIGFRVEKEGCDINFIVYSKSRRGRKKGEKIAHFLVEFLTNCYEYRLKVLSGDIKFNYKNIIPASLGPTPSKMIKKEQQCVYYGMIVIGILIFSINLPMDNGWLGTAISILAGAFIGSGVARIKILNKKIKTEEEIEKYIRI